MRLFRQILFAAIVPALALLLASAFAPAGPPSASAAAETPPETAICRSAPADWLDAIWVVTRDLLS